MLFTNRAYTKNQDIHDQESFRKSGLLYTAFQSPIQFIKSKSFKTQQKIKDFLCNMFEFINLLWSLIFTNSNNCIVCVQQDR